MFNKIKTTEQHRGGGASLRQFGARVIHFDMPFQIRGRKLRAARKHYGLTQAQLAQAFGVSRGTINNWEHGHTTPDLDIEETVQGFVDGWTAPVRYMREDQPVWVLLGEVDVLLEQVKRLTAGNGEDAGALQLTAEDLQQAVELQEEYQQLVLASQVYYEETATSWYYDDTCDVPGFLVAPSSSKREIALRNAGLEDVSGPLTDEQKAELVRWMVEVGLEPHELAAGVLAVTEDDLNAARDADAGRKKDINVSGSDSEGDHAEVSTPVGHLRPTHAEMRLRSTESGRRVGPVSKAAIREASKKVSREPKLLLNSRITVDQKRRLAKAAEGAGIGEAKFLRGFLELYLPDDDEGDGEMGST